MRGCIDEEVEEKEKAKEKKNKILRRLSRKKRELPPSITSCASRSLVGLRRIITFAREATTLNFSIHSS